MSTNEELVIVPREEWRWGRRGCESRACYSTKKASGYCAKHERRWLLRRRFWLWLSSPFRRASAVPAKRPRSPRELGLYD